MLGEIENVLCKDILKNVLSFDVINKANLLKYVEKETIDICSILQECVQLKLPILQKDRALRFKLFQKLLELKSDVFLEICPHLDRVSFFRFACRYGNFEHVKFLLPTLTLDDIRLQECYAFRIACQNGHVKIVALLLTKLTYSDTLARKNEAFRSAVDKGHFSVVRMLFKHYDLDDIRVCQNESFRNACRGGYCKIVKLLLTKLNREDICSRQRAGFREAFYVGHRNLAKLLVQRLDPNDIHTRNGDALYRAIQSKYGEIVRLCLAKLPEKKEHWPMLEGGFESACLDGNLEIVHTLLFFFEKNNIPFSLDDAFSNACESGQHEIVKLFLSRSDFVTRCLTNIKAFVGACKGGNLEIVQILFNQTNQNITFDQLCDGFLAAARCGYVKIVQFLSPMLLEDCKKSFPIYHEKEIINTFRNAGQCGSLEIVEKLLFHFGRAITRVDLGYAFLSACEFGCLEIVDFLSQQLPFNDFEHFYDEAYKKAARSGHCDVVKFLLAKKPCDTFSAKIIEEVFLHSCRNLKLDIAKSFLSNFGSIIVEETRTVALINAYSSKQKEVIQFLFENLSNDEIQQKKMAALLKACENGKKIFVKRLIAELDDITFNDNRALFMACEHKHWHIVELLLQASNVEDVCENGQKILSHAREKKYKFVVRFLLKNGYQ